MDGYQVYFDGASRNNPGLAGAGVVVRKNGSIIKKAFRFLGEKTNNEAEYEAIILSLEVLEKINIKPAEVRFIGDSQLVVKQLAGEYKIKNERLKKLYWQIREKILSLGISAQFEHIRREKNSAADKLANKAIDKHEKNKS
jgi:ribonuclease HI